MARKAKWVILLLSANSAIPAVKLNLKNKANVDLGEMDVRCYLTSE